ncbi:hypothetical protein EX353_11960 [Klebsiella pneumoniae]|nr:hypothetical protein EX353_11960 [Klebsiella pneumoniae]
MFGESGFAHGDLLQGYIQYAGRSLNVNGPAYRDAYIWCHCDGIINNTLRKLMSSKHHVLPFSIYLQVKRILRDDVI